MNSPSLSSDPWHGWQKIFTCESKKINFYKKMDNMKRINSPPTNSIIKIGK